MSIEYLIFFYMFVCIAMGVFDFAFLFYERFRDWNFRRQTKRVSKFLAHEIATNAEFPTPEHKAKLTRQMHRLPGMESFDLTMIRFMEHEPELCERYLQGIAPVFEQLTRYFANRDDLHKAYFAYIVKDWYHRRPAADCITGTLLTYARGDALYQRENALEAMASVGTPAQLVNTMVVVERNAAFHHPKLLTEAAMAFAGDPAELAEELDRRLPELSPTVQTAAINFLRMKGHGDIRRLAEMLDDPDTDPEVRIACIRYFMRRPYRPVAHTLRRLASSEDPGQWELSSVAATALGAYLDRQTVATLIRCLSSPVWYVRFNAAKSLYDAGLSLHGRYLGPVMDHGDRYARDMLSYRWAYEAEAHRRRETIAEVGEGDLAARAAAEEAEVEYEEDMILNDEGALPDLPPSRLPDQHSERLVNRLPERRKKVAS